VLTQNPSIEQRINYYSQIIAGIKFMYSRSILHRDIKPSNILVKDQVIKIADFGTAKHAAM
jgi:serine/threonine protein kinase